MSTKYSPNNFIVPNDHLLRANKQLSQECQSPGIISSTLDKIAHLQNNTEKTYKIDINFKLLYWGGKEGDVNIWSNERPILEDQIGKKNRQLETVQEIENVVQAALNNSKILLQERNQEESKEIVSLSIQILRDPHHTASLTSGKTLTPTP